MVCDGVGGGEWGVGSNVFDLPLPIRTLKLLGFKPDGHKRQLAQSTQF